MCVCVSSRPNCVPTSHGLAFERTDGRTATAKHVAIAFGRRVWSTRIELCKQTLPYPNLLWMSNPHRQHIQGLVCVCVVGKDQTMKKKKKKTLTEVREDMFDYMEHVCVGESGEKQ